MAQASRDENFITTLLAVSNVDGTTPVVLYADPVTHRLLVDGVTLVAAPASAAASGVAGQIAYDSSFFYVCTATNTWKRVAIATW